MSTTPGSHYANWLAGMVQSCSIPGGALPWCKFPTCTCFSCKLETCTTEERHPALNHPSGQHAPDNLPLAQPQRPAERVGEFCVGSDAEAVVDGRDHVLRA